MSANHVKKLVRFVDFTTDDPVYVDVTRVIVVRPALKYAEQPVEHLRGSLLCLDLSFAGDGGLIWIMVKEPLQEVSAACQLDS